MKDRDLSLLLKDFESFCSDNNNNSFKSVSYKLALKYLCEFLNIHFMNQMAFDLILKTRTSLQDKNSATYTKCQEFLSKRGQIGRASCRERV